MPKLREEIKRKIRELQESGIGDAEISRRLGIPYSTVRYQRPEIRECWKKYYQRPEIRENKKKYMQEYRQRPEVKERRIEYYRRPEVRKRAKENYQRRILESDLAFKELLNFIEGDVNGHLNDENIYVSILQFLKDTEGKKYKRIVKYIGSNVCGKLRRLKKLGLIIYEDKEYKLSKKGEKLIKELYKF